MNYYPVAIPTLCRYEHFKRCIESLAQNTHADKTEIIIGLDYPLYEKHKEGYNKICDYISNIRGFKKVTLFKREKNYGAIKNYKELASYAFSKYNACIFSEDDNEFSPCFLDYMNKSLEKYENTDQIVSISGYTTPCYSNITKYKTICTYDSSAWGIGIWKNKFKEYDRNSYNLLSTFKSFWKVYKIFPASVLMFLHMINNNAIYEDTIKTIENILNNKFQLRPESSLVRNWGIDGSGIHCGIDESFSKQKIQDASFFELDEIPIMIDKKINDKSFYVCLPSNKIRAWHLIIKTGLLYLKFKLINRI